MEPLKEFAQLFADQNEARSYANQLNKDPGWKEALPDCPCTEAQAKASPKYEEASIGLKTYHPGAQSAYRSAEPVTYQHSALGEMHAGQQCTYDSHGNLITSGSGAGTPDSVSPEFSSRGHFLKDVATHNALGDREYNQTWTPNQGNNCNQRFQNLNDLKNATPNAPQLDLKSSSTNPQLENLKLDTPASNLPSPSPSHSSHPSPSL